MEKNSQIKIFLDPIALYLRIGLHAHEKTAPQRVIISVALYAEPIEYLRDVTPQNIIDYSVLYETIMRWPELPHTELIEQYVQDLLGLCFEIPNVTACNVAIRKADIFGTDQGAGVEVFLRRTDFLRE
jgi:dihydroneopterin aldolase